MCRALKGAAFSSRIAVKCCTRSHVSLAVFLLFTLSLPVFHAQFAYPSVVFLLSKIVEGQVTFCVKDI